MEPNDSLYQKATLKTKSAMAVVVVLHGRFKDIANSIRHTLPVLRAALVLLNTPEADIENDIQELEKLADQIESYISFDNPTSDNVSSLINSLLLKRKNETDNTNLN